MSAKAANQARRKWTGWFIVVALLVVLVATALFVVTRGVSWRDQVPVVEAHLSEQDKLTLVVNTCGGEPELGHVREENDVVVVGVVSTRTFGGPGGRDCLDPVEVRLQAPLGDRRLVDTATGDDIAVETG